MMAGNIESGMLEITLSKREAFNANNMAVYYSIETHSAQGYSVTEYIAERDYECLESGTGLIIKCDESELRNELIKRCEYILKNPVYLKTKILNWIAKHGYTVTSHNVKEITVSKSLYSKDKYRAYIINEDLFIRKNNEDMKYIKHLDNSCLLDEVYQLVKEIIKEDK